MAGKDEEEERKGGAAAVPAFGAGGAGPAGWSLDLLLTAPRFALLRVLAGAAVALCGAWAGSAVLFPKDASAPATAPAWETRPGVPDESAGARPAMGGLVRGMAGLYDSLTGRIDAEALADAAGAAVPPPGDAAGAKGGPEKAADGAGGKGDGKGGGEGEEGGSGMAVAPGLSDSGGTFVPGAVLGGGGAGAGAATGALLAAAPPAGAAGAAAPGGAEAGALKRDMRAARNLSGASAARRAGKSGALSQLKFADGRSRLGAVAGGSDTSYAAERSAFEGSPGAVSGPAVTGAGAAQGGAGLGSTPATPTGPLKTSGQRYSCPSGYQLEGTQCIPLPGAGENKTPYQGMADKAKMALIIGAVLAAVGTALLFSEVPWAQVLGGMLLGAALALVAMALAIGNQIDSQFGQGAQKRAIQDAGGKAAKGTAPK